MGLGIPAVKLTLELWKRGLLKDVNSVIDMGAQELHLKLTDFEYLLNSAGIEDYSLEEFTALRVWPGAPRMSAKQFYKLLGLTDYKCLDLQKSHDSIVIDLNYPLEDKALFGKFNLVTDHGNNEHPFNLPEAYRTMHRLCSKNGLMLIMQSVWKGNGFFTFDESFFESIAAANNYQVLISSYVVNLKSMTPAGSNNQFLVPLSADLIDALDYSKVDGLSICYVFRKSSDEDFKYPYEKGILRSEADRILGYSVGFHADPPSRHYTPSYEANITTNNLIRALLGRVKGKIRRIGK